MNNNKGVDYSLTHADDQYGYAVTVARGRYDFPNAKDCEKNKYVQSSPTPCIFRPVIICMIWEKRMSLITYYHSGPTFERNKHQEKMEKEGDNLK